jgi:hypothetical protein
VRRRRECLHLSLRSRSRRVGGNLRQWAGAGRGGADGGTHDGNPQLRRRALAAGGDGRSRDGRLGVAERGESAGEAAILPATLADSVETWPALLRIARNDRVSSETRKSALFWLGQAAGEAATRGLDSIARDPKGDREVREAAVFALSQRPEEEGVPALIRIARSNHDPELRRKAIFWLGQSEAPAALALFEELLTKP